jgi:transcription termination factor NusA
MSRSILEVKGIGPATAVLLAENGITTAEELAAKSPLQVAAVKGFSEARATQVIANARALLTESPLVQNSLAAVKGKAIKKKTLAEKKTKANKGSAETAKKAKKAKKSPKERDKKKDKKAEKAKKKVKKNPKKKKS